MFTPIWSGFKQALKWVLLLSSPLILFQILTGVGSGTLGAIYVARHLKAVTETYLEDFADAKKDWGVPGAMSFRKFQDTKNDFHIIRLNSDDWFKKLDFIRPKEFDGSVPGAPTPEVEKWADLDNLMRDISVHPSSPKEQWVFITDWVWPMVSEWDAAFDEAIQYSYTNSRLNNSGIWYASCTQTARFLCEMWQVRAPTLIHFRVHDRPPVSRKRDPILTYRCARQTQLRRVTARVIEFPLEGEYTGLSSTTFPSYRVQIASMMAGERLYEQFEPYRYARQATRRVIESLRKTYTTEGTVWYYLSEVDKWIEDHITGPLGLKGVASVMHQISFGLSIFMEVGAYQLYTAAADLVKEFLGYPSIYDRVNEEDKYADLKGGPNNPWDALLGGLVGGAKQVLEQGIQQAEAEREPSPDAVTTDIDRMRAELSERMESILAQARATPGAPL